MKSLPLLLGHNLIHDLVVRDKLASFSPSPKVPGAQLPNRVCSKESSESGIADGQVLITVSGAQHIAITLEIFPCERRRSVKMVGESLSKPILPS
jgi:hypothetical protein